MLDQAQDPLLNSLIPCGQLLATIEKGVQAIEERASPMPAFAHCWVCLKTSTPAYGSQEFPHIFLHNGKIGILWHSPCQMACSVCGISEAGKPGEYLLVENLQVDRNYAIASPLQGSGIVIPLTYQKQSFATLIFVVERPEEFSKVNAAACIALAQGIAYHIKRYEFGRLTRERFGKELMLIGDSAALREQDRFIERAAQTDLPALIIGEPGCEKEPIAYALHLAGWRRDKTVIAVNGQAISGENYEEALTELYIKADHGTLFIENIDELSYPGQRFLAHLLSGRTGQLKGMEKLIGQTDVRLIVSANQDLYRLAKAQEFYPPLLQNLDFLSTRIAPLRDRKADLKPLIEYFLQRYLGKQVRRISPEALQLCERYDWPGNLPELERVIAKLTVMGEEEMIQAHDLYEFAPQLTQNLQRPKPSNHHQSLKHLYPSRLIEPKTLRLIADLLNGETAAIAPLHTSVQKALAYLAKNFQEEISLTKIAEQACLSPSHLCFLLQTSVGASFKTLLALIRIEKAKALLTQKPALRITDISSEVGFGELSHFERTFKRLLNCTPREYRLRNIKP